MNKTQLSVTLNFLEYCQENINNCIEYLNIFDKEKKDSLTLCRIFSNNNTSIMLLFLFVNNIVYICWFFSDYNYQ